MSHVCARAHPWNVRDLPLHLLTLCSFSFFILDVDSFSRAFTRCSTRASRICEQRRGEERERNYAWKGSRAAVMRGDCKGSKKNERERGMKTGRRRMEGKLASPWTCNWWNAGWINRLCIPSPLALLILKFIFEKLIPSRIVIHLIANSSSSLFFFSFVGTCNFFYCLSSSLNSNKKILHRYYNFLFNIVILMKAHVLYMYIIIIYIDE